MLISRPVSVRSMAVALLAAALLLWLNFAYIEHQYELSSTHHSEHHCQLFASGLHGASPAPLNLLAAPLNLRPDVTLTTRVQEVVFYAYQPRSPPLS
ncbi:MULTISPECIES: DUF2607 family protein [unclassified Vibrio]|uniref:DUF2607 family protein n=2 Tax=Vibrio TaxID=662 RepID=UPI00110FFF19|nr:DUF2607 family protein [Vibrio sp. Hep-1b-8]TMX42310.1 DUF2607 domain-containing protein [Vibrio sp. Hep-1b-8]